MIKDPFLYFLIGGAGALCFEVLKVYEYRHKLTSQKWKKMLRSKLYWGVFVGMVLASGFFAWAFNAKHQEVDAWQVVLSGIASRSLIRELLAAKAASADKVMGDEVDAKDIFT